MTEHTETKKEGVIEIPVGKSVEKIRKNPWIFSTIILIIVLIVLIFVKTGSGGGVATVSGQDAAKNLINFVNSQGQGTATFVSAENFGSLYKITVNYNGADVPTYVSLDGKYFLPSAVPLTDDAATALGTGSTGTTGTTGQSTASLKISDLNLDDYVSLGNKSAKVTVVEFSDFSCPYCEAASGDNVDMVANMVQRDPTWEPIVNNLMKDYVDTGKVRFVYIYSMGHTGGHSASLVAWCLYDQNPNYFEQFYTKAFASTSADTEDLTKMQTLAGTITGVNSGTLQQCLDSKKYDSRFASEQSIADKVGAQGTPAFFVNDQYVAHGAESYVQFKQSVDAALAA